MNDLLTATLNELSLQHSSRMDLSLERVDSVAASMGLKTWLCPIIHVAGTNGKGTCVEAFNQIYTQEGYRVGVFTSPHLHDYCERIRVGNQEITEIELVQALRSVNMGRGEVTLTLFESLWLAALVYFKQQALDALIVEVGLGGRLDATNILPSTCGVIASVSRDHEDWLGSDLEGIAREKAGIMKASMATMVHACPTFESLFDEIGAEHGVRVLSLGREIMCKQMGHDWIWKSLGQEVRWHNLHSHGQNLALVCTVLQALQNQLACDWDKIGQYLSHLSVPGRCQQVSKRPDIWVDVAHNEASSHLLFEKMSTLPAKKLVVIMAIQQTKSMQSILTPWLRHVDEWWCVDGVADTMISVSKMVDYLNAEGCHHVKEFATMEKVVEQVMDACSESKRYLVFGSFLTVAAFVQHNQKE